MPKTERARRPSGGSRFNPYAIPGLDLARSKSDISSSLEVQLPPALPFVRCRSEPREALQPVEEVAEGEQLERPLASSFSIHLGLDQLGLNEAEVTPPLPHRRPP